MADNRFPGMVTHASDAGYTYGERPVYLHYGFWQTGEWRDLD